MAQLKPVAFIDEMDSSRDLSGIDVPQSLLASKKEEPIMENDTLIAVDLAKSVFEIAVSEQPGKVSQRWRLPRSRFVSFFANRPAAAGLGCYLDCCVEVDLLRRAAWPHRALPRRWDSDSVLAQAA